MKRIQYTIRDVPLKLDRALRERCSREGRSLNAAVLDALARGAGWGQEAPGNSDFDHLAGKWVRDRQCEAALDAMRETIDAELWR
jgi:hypothetical protein